MRGLNSAPSLALLLLFVVAPLGTQAWGGNSDSQDRSPRLVSVKTYAIGAFHESLKDRLSGGVPQGVPYRMAADSQGRIVVTDPSLSVLHVLDTRHGIHWQIKGDQIHPLHSPTYIALDADSNIYVTDLEQSAITVLDPSGGFIRTIGLGVLKLPTGIWVDEHDRKLYVADWVMHEVLSFDLEGRLLQVFGSLGTARGQLYRPLDIVVHDDTLIVLDSGNSRFESFDLDGRFHSVLPFGPDRKPIAFAFDSASNLYYVDSRSGGLVAMDQQGKMLAGLDQRTFGRWVPRSARPNFTCVALDALGKVLALRPTFDVEVVELTSDGT